jgi:hypothetical protein
LTKVELQTSMNLLLNQTATSALSNLDADSQINGGFSNADQLTVTDSFANSLNLAADTIGTQFKATVTTSNYAASCFTTDAAAETCAQTFIQTFGKKAFRRDITSDDVTALTAVYEAGRAVGIDGNTSDRFATGLSYVVRAIVQSPDFLYLTELGDPSVANGAKTTLLPAELASAISYSVVGMPPDDTLLAAIAGNQLSTGDQRSAQALRLINDHPNEWQQQMRQFVSQWIGINFNKPQWEKDTSLVPLFSDNVKAALSTENDMVINDWATAPNGALLSTLLTSPTTFVNSVNAPVYGVTASGTTFQKVNLDPTQRAGILTLAGFLGSTSHVGETSPVLRGKAIMMAFLCRSPPPPPPNVPPLPPPDMSAPTTTRARYDEHLVNPACSGCHSAFQPMGDAFEEFDPLGSFRSQQNGFPIDASGALVGTSAGDVPVMNALDLASVLAQTPDVVDCVTRQSFRFTVGHLETDYDACNLPKMKQTFMNNQNDVRALISAIVGSDSFVVRTVNIAQ